MSYGTVKYCYACYCKSKKNVLMKFDKNLGKFGGYKCAECSHIGFIHDRSRDDKDTYI